MRHAWGLSAEDRLDLSDLVHRYAAYVDAGQVDDVVALFAEDAVMVVPEPPGSLTPTLSRPRDRIHEAMTALEGLARTAHEIVGEVYDSGSTEGTARGLVKGVAHHVVEQAVEQATAQATEHEQGLLDVVWRVLYADDYVRTADGWRFARRALTIELIEQRSVASVRR